MNDAAFALQADHQGAELPIVSKHQSAGYACAEIDIGPPPAREGADEGSPRAVVNGYVVDARRAAQIQAAVNPLQS